MPYERTGYAPWSLTREAGVESATVDGTIQVPQYGQPVIDIGFVDEKGDWKGRRSSERVFGLFQKDEAVANGASILYPSDGFDMSGFRHMMLAIRPTNGGNMAIKLVMGPDTKPFYNLTPINSNAVLKGFVDGRTETMGKLADDSAENIAQDVWNIFTVQNYDYDGYANIQWNITNNTGDIATIELALLRLV